MARVVVGAELLSAVLLVVPPVRVWGLVFAVALFSAFLIGMGSVLRRGMRVSCGCLQAAERVGAASLTRTALLVLAEFGADTPFEAVQLPVAVLLIGVAGLVPRRDAQPPGQVVGERFEIGADVSAFADGGDRSCSPTSRRCAVPAGPFCPISARPPICCRWCW
ncbi:MauE/DoxX family redox-associated membrane protein [Saccharopolyspora sp. NPDC002376]